MALVVGSGFSRFEFRFESESRWSEPSPEEETVPVPKVQDIPLPSKLLGSVLGTSEAAATQSAAAWVVDDAMRVMVYDIPFTATEEDVMGKITEYGFARDTCCQIVSMPASKGGSRTQSLNQGYAFVNFKEVEFAEEFLRTFQNVPFANCDQEGKLACSKQANPLGDSDKKPKQVRRGKRNGCLATFITP